MGNFGMWLALGLMLYLPSVHVLRITVSTNHGMIFGNTVFFRNGSVDEYLGVPYAKPPTGQRRFKKPEPVDWFGSPLSATKMPPGCPQFKLHEYPTVADPSQQSEDCLYLNIWVPHPRFQRKAVMFWIHGGGFTVGGNRLEIYNGNALAHAGGVIVVTVNYRLNALGFLFSGTEDAPGNMGLYDVLLALKWVKNNIASFGGDPDNITIFGQSAGSITIGTLAVSPLARGLYRRAIMESGASTYLEGNNITRNAVLSQKVAKAMNCADDSNTIWNNPAGVVACLRETDAYELAKVTALQLPDSLRVFQPQFGDDIVPVNTRLAVINGDFHDTDLLIGDTTEEGSTTLIIGKSEVFGVHGEKNTLFNKIYARQLLEEKLGLENIDPIYEHYLGSVPDDDLVQIRRQTFTALGDKIYVCPDILFAERHAQKGNRVYFYVFARRPSTSKFAEWMGATHISEVPFVFGQPVLNPREYTLEEKQLSNYVMQKWSAFAKYGHPGNEWPEYSEGSPEVLRIDTPDPLPYRIELEPTNCNVFRPYFGVAK